MLCVIGIKDELLSNFQDIGHFPNVSTVRLLKGRLIDDVRSSRSLFHQLDRSDGSTVEKALVQVTSWGAGACPLIETIKRSPDGKRVERGLLLIEVAIHEAPAAHRAVENIRRFREMSPPGFRQKRCIFLAPAVYLQKVSVTSFLRNKMTFEDVIPNVSSETASLLERAIADAEEKLRSLGKPKDYVGYLRKAARYR